MRFNDREKRDYPQLGSFGVIDAESYTGDIDIDRGAMQYDDADTIEVAVEQARGLDAEQDYSDEPPVYTVTVESADGSSEETVEPQLLIRGWEEQLKTQVKSKHYKDVDPRTAAHELHGYKTALNHLGLLGRDETAVDPDHFAPGMMEQPLPREPEELLAYVCDKVCKHLDKCNGQDELDTACAKCSAGRLMSDAKDRDLRIMETAKKRLDGLIQELSETQLNTKREKDLPGHLCGRMLRARLEGREDRHRGRVPRGGQAVHHGPHERGREEGGEEVMLRDVKHHVTDKNLGFATATGDGRHLKIGVSPVVSDTPIVVTGAMDAAQIKSCLGLSPLADAVMDSVQFGANRVFCLPVSASTAGDLGDVSKTGDGGGKMTVDGSPTNAFSVVVKFTAQGGLNSAAFAVSIDGGSTFTDEITVPVTGEYELEGTGLTLHFEEAEEPDQKPSSFLVNDSYTFTTTAPTMTNGDVLNAITKLQNFAEEYEFVHIVGESDLALWQAVGEAQEQLFEMFHKPMFFVMEAAFPTPSEGGGAGPVLGGGGMEGDLTDWALEMEAKAKKVRNYNIQVVTAWGRLVKLDGSTKIVNLAGLVSGLYAKSSVQTSIGKTREEAGFGIRKTKLERRLYVGRNGRRLCVQHQL